MAGALAGCQVRDKVEARPDARTDFTPPDATPLDGRPPDAAIPLVDALLPDAPLHDAPLPDAPLPDAPLPMHDAPLPMPDAPLPMPDAPPMPVLLPDLTLLSERMGASILIRDEFVDGNSCALNECLSAFGVRTLLRFETAAFNAGTAAMIMGPPQPSQPQWDYDSCHMHYHYLDFAEYQLVDAKGTLVAMGHKQSFCVRDDIEVIPGSPSAGYDCQVQGLSAGWADVYSNALDCQYVDITGVAPGTYQLRIELNPARRMIESNYDNNVATFPVVVP